VISTGSGVRPVENEFSAPAVTETGAERSWYPLSFRSTVWLPAARPGIVVGETPRWTPSIETDAPAGVVITESEPVPGIIVPVDSGEVVVVPAATVVVVPAADVVADVVASEVVVVVAADVVIAAVVVEAAVVVVVVVTVVVGVVVNVVVTAVSVLST
jgi:hypothetical protein